MGEPKGLGDAMIMCDCTEGAMASRATAKVESVWVVNILAVFDMLVLFLFRKFGVCVTFPESSLRVNVGFAVLYAGKRKDGFRALSSLK